MRNGRAKSGLHAGVLGFAGRSRKPNLARLRKKRAFRYRNCKALRAEKVFPRQSKIACILAWLKLSAKSDSRRDVAGFSRGKPERSWIVMFRIDHDYTSIDSDTMRIIESLQNDL